MANAAIQYGTTCDHRGKKVIVVVVRAGNGSCRVIPMRSSGDYFPESYTVPRDELTPTAGQPKFDHANHRPYRGTAWRWDPPGGRSSSSPANGSLGALPPQNVRVIALGWEVTRVAAADVNGGPSGLVYNHHVKREPTRTRAPD